MDSKNVWNKIINKLREQQPLELHTVPTIAKTPVWFSSATDGGTIFIDNALINSPSSKISSIRKLTYKDFEKIYPIFLRREKGESVSKEATNSTRNQVYYFSLIKHLG